MPSFLKDTFFYNTQSTIYSAIRYPIRPVTFTQFFFKARLKRILKLIATKSPQSILEIGCADGIVSRAIWRQFPMISRFDAVDTAPEMIRVATKQHADTPVHFSVRKESFFKEKYDLIVEIGVLNVVDIGPEFKCVAAALAPQGYYICSIAGRSSIQNRLKSFDGHLHLQSYIDYEREMEKYFAIEYSEAIGFFIPLVWKLPQVARVIQQIGERIGRFFVPSLALEKIYILTPKQHT